ncbi:MAG: choice-of-anchor Q domain-containing protein [Panacagrimonas sp.]
MMRSASTPQSRFHARRTALAAAVATLFALPAMPGFAANILVADACTLVDAITAANLDTATGECIAGDGDDTIVLLAGSTHTLTAVDNTGVDQSGPNGLPLVTSRITIAGNHSTLRRNPGSDEFRLLAIDEEGELTINQATLTGGQLSGDYYAGGGILNLGVLSLNGCTVTGNFAPNDGGGIASFDFSEDEAPEPRRRTPARAAYSLSLTRSVVSGNTTADDGAGLYVGAGKASVTDSTVSGNTAESDGGGIFVGYGAALLMVGSTVSGNSSDDGGGGIYGYSADVSLLNSTVSGNRAVFGAGIYGVGGDNRLSLANTTVARNAAGRRGGGLYVDDTLLTLTNSLISGNTATFYASELYVDDSSVIDLQNNLFGHRGLNSYQAFNNFVPGGSTLTATSDGSQPTRLENILDTRLANNGGPTLTHALVTTSPALDAGSSDCPSTDQRGDGFARPLDGDNSSTAECDIGSIEGAGRVAPPANPTVSFHITSRLLRENQGSVSVRVNLSQRVNRDVVVPFTIKGTAKRGNNKDYLLGTTRVTFPAGETRALINIEVLNDRVRERGADETVILTLGRPSNAAVGNPKTFTLSIQDND